MQPQPGARPQPALTRETAPAATALRDIADRKARGRLRAAITADAIDKAATEWTDAEGWRYQLERAPVVTISPKDIERAAATVDLKAWDASNTLIFRDRIHAWDGFPVLVPDGTGHEENDGLGGKVRVSSFRESPVEAARSDLAHTVRVVTKSGQIPWVKEKPGTVSTFYSDTSDGLLNCFSATWAGVRSAPSLITTDTTATLQPMGAWKLTSSDYYAYVLYWSFDTSSLTGEAVSSVQFSLYPYDSVVAPDAPWDFLIRQYDWDATLTSADWRAPDGSDLLLATLPYDESPTGSYADFYSETAFTGAINTSGATRFYGLCELYESATEPTDANLQNFYSAERSGTTQDPKLVVTHAAASVPFRRSLLGVGF